MASQWHPLLKKRVYGPSRQNKKDAKQDDAKLTLQIKKEVKEEKVKKQSEEFFGNVADTWLEANKKTYADQTAISSLCLKMFQFLRSNRNTF